jgi:hypothetical protein
MSNLVSSLKSEIVRLSRKEAKSATAPLRKPSVAARKAIADLKRRLADLEKELRRVNELLGKMPSAQPCQAEPAPSDVKMRITSRNVKSLRNRLGLTASAFAKLLGVTDNWVYLYEHKAGALKMRTATLKAFQAAKAMTAKEARAKLGIGK